MKKKRNLIFTEALKSFVGHLEGAGHALGTIESYRQDMAVFEGFLRKSWKRTQTLPLERLRLEDIKNYAQFLKTQSYRTNTRRHKLITLRKFLGYLKSRNWIGIDIARAIPTPSKVENVPHSLVWSGLIQAIQHLPGGDSWEARTRAMLWVMAETGCRVSEIPKLRFSHVLDSGELVMGSSSNRRISISKELLETLRSIQASAPKQSGRDSKIFVGFNRFGPLPGATISARGVELALHALSPKLGLKALIPRTVRHSRIEHWIAQGVPKEEIRRRLGLKSLYAFRRFEDKSGGESKT